MKKIIIKKENGITMEAEIIENDTENDTLEQSKETIVSKNLYKNFTKEDISSARYFADKVLDSTINICNSIEYNKGTTMNENFYECIKKAKDMDDLKKVIDSIINQYKTVVPNTSKKTNTISNIENMLINTPDLIYSMIIKKIVKLHCIKILNDLDKTQINSIQNLKLKGTSIDNILKFIGENFDNVSIENGVAHIVYNTFSDLINKTFFKTSGHLCWENCENAEIAKCQKIHDLIKKRISEYDFITDGIQKIDENGNLDRFIVTGCKNYSLAPEKKLTSEEKQRIRELKIGLKLDYFDAENLDEANEIQKYLIKTHQLSDPRKQTYVKKD